MSDAMVKNAWKRAKGRHWLVKPWLVRGSMPEGTHQIDIDRVLCGSLHERDSLLVGECLKGGGQE